MSSRPESGPSNPCQWCNDSANSTRGVFDSNNSPAKSIPLNHAIELSQSSHNRVNLHECLTPINGWRLLRGATRTAARLGSALEQQRVEAAGEADAGGCGARCQ